MCAKLTAAAISPGGRSQGSLYVTAKESTSHGLARRLMGILLALNPELELKPDVHALLRVRFRTSWRSIVHALVAHASAPRPPRRHWSTYKFRRCGRGNSTPVCFGRL